MNSLRTNTTLASVKKNLDAAAKRSDISRRAAATVKMKKEAKRIASRLTFNTAPILRRS